MRVSSRSSTRSIASLYARSSNDSESDGAMNADSADSTITSLTPPILPSKSVKSCHRDGCCGEPSPCAVLIHRISSCFIVSGARDLKEEERRHGQTQQAQRVAGGRGTGCARRADRGDGGAGTGRAVDVVGQGLGGGDRVGRRPAEGG